MEKKTALLITVWKNRALVLVKTVDYFFYFDNHNISKHKTHGKKIAALS